MSKEDLERQMRERLVGWRMMPDGKQIAYLEFFGSAVFPMDGKLALMFRFDGRRKGQTSPVTEQLQLGLSPEQCRVLARQLLEGADYLDKELKRPSGPVN